MEARKVDVLLILGGNPVYTAPADLDFGKRLEKVPLRLHLGAYQDETAEQCQWHVPEAHYLESWGDARAFDGTVSVVQPLIEPLFGGRTAQELLASLTRQTERSALETVKGYWRRTWAERNSSGDFESFWEKTLHDGVMPGTELAPRTVELRVDWDTRLPPPADAGQGTEIVFRPDPTVYDGRFANNGWLQELPRPLTKLTWGNAVLVSPKTARDLKIKEERPAFHGGEHGEVMAPVVDLTFQGRKLENVPLFIQAGHADDAVTVHLGHGRTRAGRVGNGVGFNANLLRTSAAAAGGSGLEVKLTSRRVTLACTQFHHWMERRDIIRSGTLEDYRKDPHAPARPHEAGGKVELPMAGETPLTGQDKLRHPQLFPEYPHKTPYQWGMGIDLTACIGCNACVVGCQAENNVPVVGKDQVTRGREMHWLRIDTYYEGQRGDREAEANPHVHFQPVPCMHCENAPCELVCPVAATVHSDDGLNDMVYNRCVGTRYCSNNCPYKVRRFNFLPYTEQGPQNLNPAVSPTVKLGLNPEVTVRSRGVMEKCTYCVQRIRNGLIEAKRQGRDLHDGEILTACQAACPTGAIVFGDINDRTSAVARWKATPLDYGLLADLNTRPRTTYLAGLRNPNPELGNP
jgi:molybdopterin-containing oxidoreductase family iron-sulfur binding subunit